MKKVICAVLCLMMLSMAAIAAADNPAITEHPTTYSYRHSYDNGVTAYVKGAPAKAGYYSSAIVSLTAYYRNPYTLAQYTRSGQKSVNGGWGQGTSLVSITFTGYAAQDILGGYTAKGTYQYYGIR